MQESRNRQSKLQELQSLRCERIKEANKRKHEFATDVKQRNDDRLSGEMTTIMAGQEHCMNRLSSATMRHDSVIKDRVNSFAKRNLSVSVRNQETRDHQMALLDQRSQKLIRQERDTTRRLRAAAKDAVEIWNEYVQNSDAGT